MFRRCLFSALLLVLASPGSRAEIWRVAADGSGDFLTIQEAIDFASPGDEILVASGTYPGRLDTRGKTLTLTGEEGAERTVVDAEQLGSALTIPFTPAGGPTIRGLSFVNGIGTPLRSPGRDGRAGGGVWIELAFGLFEDCLFAGNRADLGGGAFVVSGGPRFVRCEFSGNAAGEGAGIALDQDAGTRLEECRIVENYGVFGGGLSGFRARPIVAGTTIARNSAAYGGAVYLLLAGPGPARFEGSLLVDNYADEGGGIWAREALLSLDETTLAGNRTFPGGASVELFDVGFAADRSILETRDGPLLACEGGSRQLDCLVLWSPGGQGLECGEGERVVVADPLFCGAEEGDHTLRSDSPCLPGQGPPGCGRIGALGLGCDVPVPVETIRWGAVRTRFR